MSQIIHVQTTVQTVFGLLDEDGNVLPQQPVAVQINRFAPDAFTEAYAAIAKARDDATERLSLEDRNAIAT